MNNFSTMREITKLKDQPFTPKMVFDIHRMVTAKTMDDPSAAGRFRRSDEIRVVGGECSGRPLRPVDNVVALPLDKITIAQSLKKAGYVTGLFADRRSAGAIRLKTSTITMTGSRTSL